MGKIFVFLPMIMFMGFFLLLILGFLFLVFKLIKKSKNMAWKGEVIDKMHKQRRDFDNPKRMLDFYTIIFKTEEGKPMKIGVSAQDFQTKWQVGDKAEKKKGELWPRKL